MSKTYSLDMGRVLNAIANRDFDFYSRCTDDEKKDINMWVLMRFISNATTNKEHYLILVNGFVNVNFNDIGIKNHKELLWKLFCVCGLGQRESFKYVKPKSVTKTKLMNALEKIYPSYKDYEIEMFINSNTEEDLIDLLKDYNYEDADIIKSIIKG